MYFYNDLDKGYSNFVEILSSFKYQYKSLRDKLLREIKQARGIIQAT